MCKYYNISIVIEEQNSFFEIQGNRFDPLSSDNISSEDEAGEVSEEDEGLDSFTGKPRFVGRRIRIIHELSDLFAPFVQSKQILDFTNETHSGICLIV